ncbi:stage II sporulation protein D [Oceanobacillus chungangensis]|uniref:Stage II sporulation protein D n=2 Tax=Oceanobacillus chungangensis TaxID=1229152 RepID=A0A3D8PXQ4_9BACI|nr:stage II sporulation protein D [Oceanobacillus chungangensis]
MELHKKRKQDSSINRNKAKPVKRQIIPFTHRSTIHFNRGSKVWRAPTIIILASLMMIILVIPTLVVTPFANENKQEASSIDMEQNKELEIDEQSSLSVEVMRHATETIEDLPLETYVAGVIAAEMPVEFELEALKAQALAARTFTVNHLLHGNKESEYDLTDTVTHQVYKNELDLQKQWGSSFSANMNKIKEAVNATKGEIITYQDAPITAQFFSTSNGFTENSEDYWENELPYLRSVESPWDKESPKFLDQGTFSIGEVAAALQIELPKDAALNLEITRTKSGRVKELAIEGHTFSGREIRDKLKLRSNDFKIDQNNDHLVFTTKGNGHGVGMSQYGANGMAKEGKTYQEIIKYYYQGVEINTVTDTAPTLVSK